MGKVVRFILEKRVELIAALLALGLASPQSLAQPPANTPANDGSLESQLQFVPGDEKGNEVKALKTELLVSKTENLAVQQLQRLIVKFKGQPLEPELWLRMAELHMRRAKTARFFELHRESETVVHLAPQLAVKTSEKQAIREAIAIYEKIQKQFKDFDQMDLVYFNNAFARQQVNENREAEALYNRLVAQFPESSLVPDCYLAVGEINYERKDFKNALEHFLKIRAYPTARAYPYGLYKAAWTYYNLQDGVHAMKQLEEVVAFGKMVREQGLDARLDLRREALGDMTFFYGDTFNSDQAVTYFVKQAGELAVEPLILRLGHTYQRHSKYHDVSVVLQDFIRRYPKSIAVYIMRNELIKNFEIVNNRPGAIAEMIAMKAVCDNTRSNPVDLAKIEGDEIRTFDGNLGTCDEMLSETTHTLALKWHSQWLKKKMDSQLPQWAQTAYDIHLSVAKPSNETLKTRYSFAELLFQTNQFRRASEQYAVVADGASDKKLIQEAAHAALVALERANNDSWSDRDEVGFKRMAELYRKNGPEGPFMLDIDFKLGYIAYQKQHYDEAAPTFRRIGWKYNRTEKGQKAQDLYLDILNLKKDYHQLALSTKELMALGGDAARVTHLAKIHREASFSEIQTLEDKGETAKAIREYKKFAETQKGSELAPKAFWNATQLILKSGDFMAGAESAYQYSALFPKEKNVNEALVQSAQFFESMGQLPKAARVLEDLARVDVKNSAKWLSVAADFYALGNDFPKARSLYKTLLRMHSGDSKLAKADLEKWAAMEFGSTGSYGETEALVMAKGIQPLSSQIEIGRAEDLLQKKKTKEAFAEAKKILAQDDASHLAKAKARLIQADVLNAEFYAQGTKSSVEKIAAVIAMKTEKLEKVQRSYQSAIALGEPAVSVQAVRRLASAYQHYVQSIRAITLPESTPANEVAAFQKEIDSLILPIEDKAVDALNEALQAAKKVHLHDGSIADLQADLNQLNQRAAGEPAPALVTPAVVVPTFSGGTGT